MDGLKSIDVSIYPAGVTIPGADVSLLNTTVTLPNTDVTLANQGGGGGGGGSGELGADPLWLVLLIP